MTTQVAAQQVADCEDRALVQAIIEPWGAHTRTFADGAVRVAVVNTAEPAFGSNYLLILSPPHDAQGQRQCRLIGFDQGAGFTTLDIDAMIADDAPEEGVLELHLPGRITVPEYDFDNTVLIWVILNQTTGDIATFMELGHE